MKLEMGNVKALAVLFVFSDKSGRAIDRFDFTQGRLSIVSRRECSIIEHRCQNDDLHGQAKIGK